MTNHDGRRVVPEQPRAVKNRAAIIDATRIELARVGRDHLTTQAVADRAGVAIGTLYRYFADRVALLDEVAPIDEQTIGRVLRDQFRTGEPQTWDDMARAVVAHLNGYTP